MVILAANSIEDATSIRHELTLSLKVNTDRAVLDGNLGIGNSVNISDSSHNISGILSAGSLHLLVSIGAERVGAIVPQEGKCARDPATSATVAVSGAINQLLLRELYTLAVFNSIAALGCGN
jgi:hypothetical protein